MSSLKTNSQDEKKLIALLKKGDEKAVSIWFNRFHPRLLMMATKKLPSAEIAEELVQETFINSLKQLPLFEGRSQLLTWMQSILRHEIADYYRKQYAKKAIKLIPLGEMLLVAPIKDSHDISVQVQRVLDRMESHKKELLLMKYVDKKKIKEIAQEMGRTAKAVESEIFRAKAEFRQLYALSPTTTQ